MKYVDHTIYIKNYRNRIDLSPNGTGKLERHVACNLNQRIKRFRDLDLGINDVQQGGFPIMVFSFYMVVQAKP